MSFGSITNGPGLPLFTEEQGRQRMGTIGALVTDGSHVYALTSRHVPGPAGSAVSVAQQGRMVPIGVASTSATRRPVADLYPGIAATRAELDLDAGLVDLNTVDGWTSQLYGLGVMGDLIDLDVNTMGLSLIGCPVKANGAASGPLRDEVVAPVDQKLQLPRRDVMERHGQIRLAQCGAGATAVASMGSDLPQVRADLRVCAIITVGTLTTCWCAVSNSCSRSRV